MLTIIALFPNAELPMLFGQPMLGEFTSQPIKNISNKPIFQLSGLEWG